MKKRNELLDSILNSYETAIIKANKDKSDAHSGRVITRFYPTEASVNTIFGSMGKCRRAVYYSQARVSTPDETDIRALGRFKVGNILEEWIRDLAISSAIRFDHSVKIRYSIPEFPNVEISGEVDIIYKVHDEVHGDEIVGGEFKTSYGYDFESTVFHKQTIPGMPKIQHVMQVLLYLYYYKFIDRTLNISRFVITYLNRGSMEWIQHMVELSDDLYPIINGITMKDIVSGTNPVFNIGSLNRVKTRTKLIPYEFNIMDIFKRYNDVYSHHDSGLLIAADYNPLYSEQQISDGVMKGTISKAKITAYNSGEVPYLCDKECGWCKYRVNCLRDSGVI